MTSGVRWLSTGPGSGFGDGADAFLTGLRTVGVPVSWTPVGWPSATWDSPFGPLSDSIEHTGTHADIAFADIPHDTVVVTGAPIWNDRLRDEAGNRRLVAVTAWETDRYPAVLVETLTHYDQVIVPSRFNRDVLTAAGVEPPVAVVPHHIPEAPDGPETAPADGTFVFFASETWTARKAIPDLVEAFVRAFSRSDDVLLVLHSTARDLVAVQRLVRGDAVPAGAASWMSLSALIGNRPGVPALRLVTRRLEPDEMTAMHRRADCYVSLSRGEGWGLGPFRSGSLGRPVIVTGWGGALEYLPDGYPYLASYDLTSCEDDPDDYWSIRRPGERWAKVRVDHAAALMRDVYERREEAAAWGRRLAEHIARSFPPALVTARLLEALDGGVPSSGASSLKSSSTA